MIKREVRLNSGAIPVAVYSVESTRIHALTNHTTVGQPMGRCLTKEEPEDLPGQSTFNSLSGEKLEL